MDILRLLSDGQFHSGVQLAEIIGVSRTTISNRIAQWQERGVQIDSVTGKGYRLQMPIQWLDRQAILDYIPTNLSRYIQSFTVPAQVSSTNDIVADLLATHHQSGVVCVAEMQLSGRGRRGRDWLSPPAGNFYGSVGWVFKDGFSVVEGLSLAVGVAVINALTSVGASELQLKWPNDILWRGQKLGGVLIEMTGEVGGPCQVVVGVGINLQLSEKIKQEILQPVVDLKSICAAPVDRQQLTAAIISQLIALLADYSNTGFAAWHQQWLSYDAFANQQVTILGLQSPIEGVAKGVDERGALLIQTVNDLVCIHGGEVSLRHASVE